MHINTISITHGMVIFILPLMKFNVLICIISEITYNELVISFK